MTFEKNLPIKMLVFPNCKINLGLHVVSRRPDGFHEIETVFYPVGWCDALEVMEHQEAKELFLFSQSGIHIDGTVEQNLIYKAWKIISEEKKIPAIKVHLHKTIPMGAGLGGGSSDAAHFINLLNDKFNLGYSQTEKIKIASKLGSDCAFFVNNSPVFAKGKGDEFSEIKVNLSNYYILIVYPNIHSNTKEAYSGLLPQTPVNNLRSILTSSDIKEWKNLLLNDFESSIFKKYPAIKLLKENFYAAGALYSSLSGSGSAVFGIFSEAPAMHFSPGYTSFLQKPLPEIL